MKKITNREKVLVAVFLVFLVAYGYHKFIYITQINKISELEIELSIQEEKGKQVTEAAEIQEDSNEKIKEYNFTINDISKEYFPIMTQENFLKLLHEIITTLDVEMKSIPLPEYVLEDVVLNQYTEALGNGGSTLEGLMENYEKGNKPANSQENTKGASGTGTSDSSDTREGTDSSTTDSSTEEASKEEILEVNIKKISIPFNFEGSYDEFRNAVKYFNNFRRNIIISSLSVNALEGGKYSINMALDFYFIPNVEGEKSEFIKWDTTEGARMYNPFAPGSSSVDMSGILNEKPQDFNITLSSDTSDMPSVIIGKYGDASRKTYAYENENAPMDVTIEFTEENGNYYYKYKTNSDFYPKIQEGEETIGEIFTPKDMDIKIKIYSSKRVGNEDMAGINLIIKNNTSKKVQVDVIRDDSHRPRLINFSKEGNVKLN